MPASCSIEWKLFLFLGNNSKLASLVPVGICIYENMDCTCNEGRDDSERETPDFVIEFNLFTKYHLRANES